MNFFSRLPSISGLNSSNSVSLPAYFSLRLKNPMAISYTLACKIGEVTGIPCFDPSTKQPLLPLIIRQATDVQPDSNNNKGLFVVSIYLMNVIIKIELTKLIIHGLII